MWPSPAQTQKYRDRSKIRINKRNRQMVGIRKKEMREKKRKYGIKEAINKN
jgi:hypothetical protein